MQTSHCHSIRPAAAKATTGVRVAGLKSKKRLLH
jgi:hypothetical protein